MKRVVILLSGGTDSSTLLYWLHYKGYEIYPLAINYKQRHVKELKAADNIVQSLGLQLQTADISNNSFLFKNSSLTDNIEMPEGHYASNNMILTVVPNRNMVMLSLAAAYAVSCKADTIAYAAHAGDHYIYLDCRPEFYKAIAKAIKLATEVELIAPFIRWTKADIVKWGLSAKVPYELTWSCYKGNELACGKCGTCNERLEAFKLNNTRDKIKYEGDK